MRLSLGLLLSCFALSLCADGPADNQALNVRAIPPVGIEVPSEIRDRIEQELKPLEEEIVRLAENRKDPRIVQLLPDVEIFGRAVRTVLTFREFYHTNEFATASELIRLGRERAQALSRGEAPWLQQTGLVVRGYRSRIDGSAQPYGLVVPGNAVGRQAPVRLDTWFHGRGEKLSELSFIADRLRNPGEFIPARALVLHPYGRYCNANKFAGEIDLLEALDHVKQTYWVDEDRVIVRGFSMGGAACWQFAVHYPDRWAAAAPGAGFSETPEFLRTFQAETLSPAWYEKKLWHLYDATDYALNLTLVPTVAYSGAKDRQKQAADIMAKAAEYEGIQLTHLIGPNTEHSYHAETKKELNRRIDALARVGRESNPRSVHFVTYTLRYPGAFWVKLQQLERHWEKATVKADVRPDNSVKVETTNVKALTLDFSAGHAPFDLRTPVKIVLGDQVLTASKPGSDRSWRVHLVKVGNQWDLRASPWAESGWVKRPGLQGPIDDAFMEAFLFVLPSGKSSHPQVEKWIQSESQRAIVQWERHFRGKPRVKRDGEVTAEDVKAFNLVLWGDPESNQLIRRFADKTPITWTAESIVSPDAKYDSSSHIPILVYPNPEQPNRYVVLNSGFTFREYDYLNNARQVPKLPDYAIVELSIPPDSQKPGRIATAGFFGEEWEWIAPSL